MPCRRCHICGIDFPTTLAECEVCGKTLDYVVGVEPDSDYELIVEFKKATVPSVTEAAMRSWRRGELKRLGFSGAILEVLVEANTDVHLAYHLVKRGCPVDVAARILI